MLAFRSTLAAVYEPQTTFSPFLSRFSSALHFENFSTDSKIKFYSLSGQQQNHIHININIGFLLPCILSNTSDANVTVSTLSSRLTLIHAISKCLQGSSENQNIVSAQYQMVKAIILFWYISFFFNQQGNAPAYSKSKYTFAATSPRFPETAK